MKRTKTEVKREALEYGISVHKRGSQWIACIRIGSRMYEDPLPWSFNKEKEQVALEFMLRKRKKQEASIVLEPMEPLEEAFDYCGYDAEYEFFKNREDRCADLLK